MKNTQLTHKDHRPGNKLFPICFLANDIDTPMNVGSLFRIADALGVEKIILSGESPLPPNSKLTKTSRSSEKHVDYEYIKDPLDAISALKGQAYKIVSLEITNTSVDLRAFNATENDKICLVLGAENQGVNEALLAASEETIHIPMRGQNSSMNVATACAIATYEITRKMSS